MTLHCVDVVLNKCVPPPHGQSFYSKGRPASNSIGFPGALDSGWDFSPDWEARYTLDNPAVPHPPFSPSPFSPIQFLFFHIPSLLPFINSSSFYRSYNCFSSFPQYSFQRLLFLSLTLILSTVLLQLKESFHQPFSSHHVTRILSFSFGLSFYFSPTLLLSSPFCLPTHSSLTSTSLQQLFIPQLFFLPRHFFLP